MNAKRHGELILFPKTIDYYQIELTKLLEREAYGEAIRLLDFLSDCKADDKRTNEEWKTLRDWLRQQFPDAETADVPETVTEPEPEEEEELLRRHVSTKASKDKLYAKRLLESLSHSSIDKQLTALEQLAFIEDDEVAQELHRRLADHPLHPFVSFKLLQTLHKLGVSGETTFGKLGEIVTVDVERTPLSQEEFPEPFPQISERVQQVAETEDPMVAVFAKQTWEEYLTYIYGTALYREMSAMEEQELDVWASALHTAVVKAMYGQSGEEELKDQYGITGALLADWERAYEALRRFFQESAGVRV